MNSHEHKAVGAHSRVWSGTLFVCSQVLVGGEVYWSLRPHCGFDQGWDGPWFSSEIMHHLVHTSISSGGAYYNFTQMTWQVGGLMVRRATQYWLSTVASNPGNTNQALVGLRHSSSAGPWGVSQIYYLRIWHLQNQAREDVSVSEGTLKDAEGVCSPLLAEQTPGCSNCWTTGRRPLQDQVQISQLGQFSPRRIFSTWSAEFRTSRY